MGAVIADSIVVFHLRTMARLGISYDLLARESEILHLKFWDLAFEKLKTSGAIEFVTTGKMAGCWVMRDEVTEIASTEKNAEDDATASPEENNQDKIIVRSNGTVTYVGKDIAYQL
jgi:arginyl-tRNA synthetase